MELFSGMLMGAFDSSSTALQMPFSLLITSQKETPSQTSGLTDGPLNEPLALTLSARLGRLTSTTGC